MISRLRHIASIISPYNRGEKSILSILSILKRKQNSAPIPELFTAVKHLAPGLKVKTQIRAGRTVYFPAYLNEKSATYHAVRWSLAKEGFSSKIPLAQRFVTNLLDATKKTGLAYKHKKDLNKRLVESRVNYRPRIHRKKEKAKKKRRIFRYRNTALYLKRKTAIINLTYLTDKMPAELLDAPKRKFKKQIFPQKQTFNKKQMFHQKHPEKVKEQLSFSKL